MAETFDFEALAAPARDRAWAHRLLAASIGTGHYLNVLGRRRVVLEADHDCHDRWYFEEAGIGIQQDEWDNRRKKKETAR